MVTIGQWRGTATRPWVVAIALVVLALVLRAHEFGNPVIHVDEQYYLLVGDRLRSGHLPYIDLWDRKPIGLFLIYAATRLIPGEGIVAYQVAATLFAAATAMLVARGARELDARPVAAFAAGAAYLIWLPLLSGGGGQSPVFYNLFIAGAANLTLRLPVLATQKRRAAIVINGALSCLLAGLAIQTKYTPAIEGAFFGVAHLWFLRRSGATWLTLLAAALLWLSLGLAPTAAAVAYYAAKGPSALDAFWFANFASILLRGHYSYPATRIVGRLAGISAQLALFALGAGMTLRKRPRRDVTWIAFGWLLAAFGGFVVLGTFFDHYALPLLAPLIILAAPSLGRHPRLLLLTLGAGMTLLVVEGLREADDAPGARAVAAVVAANSHGSCPYVFTGDSITYYLAGTCVPTRYAFPSTLAYAPEKGATGVDEAEEVRRILATRPAVLVASTVPLAEWNQASRAEFFASVRRNYRPIFSAPRDYYRIVVYLRDDKQPAK